MNRELFQLAVQGIKRKRKSSALLFAVLCLSFAFAVISLSVTSSMEATNQNYRLETYGKWQKAIFQGRQTDLEFLKKQAWLGGLGESTNCGELIGEKGSVKFGVVDEGFIELGSLGLQDGHWPERENEIALEASSLSALGYDYTLGQKITVKTGLPATGTPDGMVTVEHTYTLCGVVKAYTGLWQFSSSQGKQNLNSGLVTEETAELLRQEGEAEAQRLREEAQEAIDQLKAEGEEIDPALTDQLNTSLDPSAPLYIFSAKEGMEEEMEQAVKQYAESLEEKGAPTQKNEAVYGSAQEQELSYHYFYAALIFAVTVFAILCIYALQLPKQVRQLALFRSVGVTKRQLRKLGLYESLLLCLPALVLGAGTGALGTWAALRLIFYSGSAPVAVRLPWALLGAMAAVWILGVFVARLVILQIALREPLTGRIAMGNKKAKRFKRAQNGLIAVLSSLLCGVILFMALESLNPIQWVERSKNWSSYSIYGGANSERFLFEDRYGTISMVTPEWRAMAESVPGTAGSSGQAAFAAELRFEGMEASDYYQGAWEARKASFQWGGYDPWYSPNALGVSVVAVSDEDLEKYLDLEELGVDPEAFRRGEEVVVALRTDVDGSYLVNMPVVEKSISEGAMGYNTERRHYKDPVLKTGDTVEVNLFGNPLSSSIVYWNSGTQEPDTESLYQFSARATVVTTDLTTDLYNICDILIDPYDVLCSYELLEKAYAQMEPGYQSKNTVTAGEFGYDYLFLRTDRTAGFLATDAVIASLCKEKGYRLMNQREENAARAQEHWQVLILLVSGGGCAALVLLLILTNTLSLEREREKRQYGVLQALGMSKRQMRRKLVKTALLRGLLGAAAGWLLFGVFLLADAPRVLQEEAAWAAQYNAVPSFTTYWEALGESVYQLQTDGASLWLVLALTAGTILLVVCLSLLSKRKLLREDLMEKLRDEQ